MVAGKILEVELMKRRLLCLLLCLIMGLTMVMASCAEKEEDEAADVDEDIGAQTITMRLVSEKKVCNTDEELAIYLEDECDGDAESQKYKDMLATKAAYDAVEAEFTKITKSFYKINVDLIFYTEDEYFDAIEVTMDEYITEQQNAQFAVRALEKYIMDYKAAYPEDNFSDEQLTMEFYKYFPEYEKYKGYSGNELSAFEEQYKENEYGINELVYPETEPNQLDIIYISGYDMYTKYIENEWIVALDEQIATTARKLNDYISSALLGGVKVDGATYAIPNNIEIGEYTYMLIDKKLFDSFYYNYEDVKSIVDCQYFLEDVAKFNPSILPIDADFDTCMKQLVWYWNINWTEDEYGDLSYAIDDSNKFSILGTVYGDPANAGRGKIELGFNSLFANEEYRNIFLTLKNYEYNNYFATENEERTNAAISFVNGNYSIKGEALKNDGVYTDENGKEYYAIVVKYPEADEESLYGNMYAISANSKNVLGCMKVLNLLNTNSELRNVLQYGVKNVNYVIDEDTGMLKRLNNNYLMKIERTGNCFIAYPEEGFAPDYWENSKKQNNDALINPLLGFSFDRELDEFDADLDITLLGHINVYVERVLNEMEDCTSYEELYELIEDAEVGLKVALANGVNPKYPVKGPDGKSVDQPVNLSKISNKAYDVATSGGKQNPDGSYTEDKSGESAYTIYYNWLVTYGFVPAAQ